MDCRNESPPVCSGGLSFLDTGQGGFRYNERMRVLPIVASVAMALTLLGRVPARAEDVEALPLYHFDPALSLLEPGQSAAPGAARQFVVIDKDEKATNVRLQTESLVAPYLGAESGPELSPEERRLLPEDEVSNGLAGYRLEAGVGLFVEDRASLNLGYRFQNPPSLLNERSNDPLSLSGDLRITFDVKVPF